MAAVLVIDYTNTDKDWSNIISDIKDLCNIKNAEYIAMRVVRDFGYRRKDAHVPNPATTFDLTDNLYKYLDDLCQGEDCKNGCQLYYDDVLDKHYFQITGANYYDKEDKYAGTDNVKVYFKEFVW